MSDTVTVTVTTQPDGSYVCSPDPVVVTTPDSLLNFELISTTHRFRNRNAVTVSNGSSEFPYPSWTTKDEQCMLLDRVSAQADYEYTLHLIVNASGDALDIDPTIRNEPN